MAFTLGDAWFHGQRRRNVSEAICQFLQNTTILLECMEVKFQDRKSSLWRFVFTVLPRLRSDPSAEHGEADETVGVRAFVCVGTLAFCVWVVRACTNSLLHRQRLRLRRRYVHIHQLPVALPPQ